MDSRSASWMDAETSDLQHASGGERIKVISSISSSKAPITIDELNRVLRFGFSDVFVVLRVHPLWREIQAEDWICTINKYGNRTHKGVSKIGIVITN